MPAPKDPIKYQKWMEARKGKHYSPKTEFKKGMIMSEATKEKQRIRMTGENNPMKRIEVRKKLSSKTKGKNASNWQGGKSKLNEIDRHCYKFRLWREKVFKRDNWTCWICEVKGGKLHPHHLKSFSKYKELRFEANNGLTLCEFCHKVYTKFGGKKRKEYFILKGRS